MIVMKNYGFLPFMQQIDRYYDSLISFMSFSFDAVDFGLRRQRYLYIMHSFKVVFRLVLSCLRIFSSRADMLSARVEVQIILSSAVRRAAKRRLLRLLRVKGTVPSAVTIMPVRSYNMQKMFPVRVRLYDRPSDALRCLTYMYHSAMIRRMYVLCVVSMCDRMQSRGLASLPSRYKLITVLRSVHIDKKSREQFKRRWLRKVRTLPRYLATFSNFYGALEVSPGVLVCLKYRMARQPHLPGDTYFSTRESTYV